MSARDVPMTAYDVEDLEAMIAEGRDPDWRAAAAAELARRTAEQDPYLAAILSADA